MTVNDLPFLNALLNATSALLLVTGYVLIRKKMTRYHRAAMLGAFAASTGFLVSYLVYHAAVGSVRFPGTGWIRTVYLTILASHSALAALVPPLALVTLSRALRGRYERHRRLARWTFPIWLYVSLTGIVIYLMLYRLYAPAV